MNSNVILKNANIPIIRIYLRVSGVYGGNIFCFGKKINVIEYEKERRLFNIFIGLLDSNKLLIKKIENYICDNNKTVKKNIYK